MSQSIVIACPATWDLMAFGRFLDERAYDEPATFSAFEDQLQLVAKSGAWELIVNEVVDRDAAVEEYESNDDLDDRFRREVGGLRLFAVRFGDIDMARRMLRGVAREIVRQGGTAWIDTDYGWVIHAGEFLKKTDDDAGWDWRSVPSPKE